MSLTSRRTAMARKRYKPEEIAAKLRQVDVPFANCNSSIPISTQLKQGQFNRDVCANASFRHCFPGFAMFERAERALHTPRHLTPSCRGHTPTAGRTLVAGHTS